MTEKSKEKQFSRRDFLKTTGVATGGIIGGSLLGGLVGFNLDSDSPAEEAETDTAPETESEEQASVEARTFFSRSEDFRTLSAAVERIYPETDEGPGAVELGVPYFIDKQLNGYWGQNSKDYKHGPFDPSRTSTHGLQERMNRGEIFLAGVRKLQEISFDEHTEEFSSLEGDQQDDILRQFESGDIDIKGTSSSTFFSLLRNTTIEGVYSDPVYGGNKNLAGWEMIKYPGPRMGWTNEIESEEFQEIAPSSLREYQGGGV